MLDGGHGGKDSGAVGPSGVKEKDVALAVVLLAGSILLGAGVDVFYTRKADTFVELPERARMANNLAVDLFVSVHCNSADRPASGFEVFTTPGQTKSDIAATEVIKAIGPEFPGLAKRFDSSDGDPDKEANFAVLRLSNMAAILVELEFIHTREGEAFLKNPVNQAKYAKVIAAGILSYLGMAQPAALDVTKDEASLRETVRRLAKELLTAAG